MLVRHKVISARYSPYPSPKTIKREGSTGRLAALANAEDPRDPNKRAVPKTQSAPARLGSLNDLAAAGQGDLVDAAYFAPPSPGQQLGGDTSAGAIGPNALSLRAPHAAGGPHMGADLDRGGVTFNEGADAAAGNIAFAETRNLGGSAVTGSFDAPIDGSGHHAKLGMTGVTNGQTVALAPNIAFHDAMKNDLGLGIALFGAAHSNVRVLPGSSGKGVAIESRHASSRGVSIDPHIAWAPVMAGAFFKMVQSQVDETLFRLSVTPRRAGSLLARQCSEGVAAPLKNWIRQWAQVTRGEPGIRQPSIHDPFGDEGGRTMRPGQVLVHHRSQTRVLGGGIGVMGMRAGQYNLKNEDMQLTVRCLDDSRVALAISPRTSEASSKNVDSPLGPNLQGIDTRARGTLSERVFDLRDAAQKDVYQRLVRGEYLADAETPPPHVTEQATLIGRDEVKGVTRIPFTTSWGGVGEHLSRQAFDVSRDELGRLSQSRTVTEQVTQHALEQGRNAWRTDAESRGSSVRAPQPACMLAFRGLRVSTERSATRPDLAMRNVMTDEHGRLWRKNMPPVTDGPRNDYKIIATTVFSGRQLGALENTIPQRAAVIAQACGAAPEALIGLIAALRNASYEAPLGSPFARAWRRSTLVGDYLQTAGATGLAALHRLLGGAVQVATESTAYAEPLQALEELRYAARPSHAKAQKIVTQLRGSLRAANADVILRTYHGGLWLSLIAKLEQGLNEAERIAAS